MPPIYLSVAANPAATQRDYVEILVAEFVEPRFERPLLGNVIVAAWQLRC